MPVGNGTMVMQNADYATSKLVQNSAAGKWFRGELCGPAQVMARAAKLLAVPILLLQAPLFVADCPHYGFIDRDEGTFLSAAGLVRCEVVAGLVSSSGLPVWRRRAPRRSHPRREQCCGLGPRIAYRNIDKLAINNGKKPVIGL